MNRTEIEWTQFTWNYVVGCTGEGCAVRDICYARAQAKRQKHRCDLCYSFRPHVHRERLTEPLHRKTPSLIFAVSMGDPLAVEDLMTCQMFTIIMRAHWHTFQILTKQAQRLPAFQPYPGNVWVGVTVNRHDDVWRLRCLRNIRAAVRFASLEPLYGAIDYDLSWLDWIIIGAQTRPEEQPKPKWVEGILKRARGRDPLDPRNPRVFMKSNLRYEPKIQAFPGRQWRMGSSGRPEAQG